jgi:hypothetical protein
MALELRASGSPDVRCVDCLLVAAAKSPTRSMGELWKYADPAHFMVAGTALCAKHAARERGPRPAEPEPEEHSTTGFDRATSVIEYWSPKQPPLTK